MIIQSREHGEGTTLGWAELEKPMRCSRGSSDRLATGCESGVQKSGDARSKDLRVVRMQIEAQAVGCLQEGEGWGEGQSRSKGSKWWRRTRKTSQPGAWAAAENRASKGKTWGADAPEGSGHMGTEHVHSPLRP